MSARDALAWLFEQGEPEARRLAVKQLTKLGAEEVEPLLLRALGDADWRVRKEASELASELSPRRAVLSCLVRALGERDNVGLRNAVVEALVQVGSDAVAPVAEALAELDADGRKLAAEVLAGIADEAAIVVLTRALADPDLNVQAAAAEGLGSAGEAGHFAKTLAVTALTAALASRETLVKLAALDALTHLDAEVPWSVLESFVSDPVLRRYAVAAAARADDLHATRAVLDALDDPQRTIAREAVVALGERVLRESDGSALRGRLSDQLLGRDSVHRRVQSFLHPHEDCRTRRAALLLLPFFGDTSDVGVVVDALDDDDVASAAERALRGFGPEAVSALIVAARQSAPPQKRALALSLFPTVAPEPSAAMRETLRVSLEDASPDVVAASLRVLALTGEASDVKKAAALTTHDDSRVAGAAAAALATLAARFSDEARRIADPARAGTDWTIACIVLGAVAESHALYEAEVAFLQQAAAAPDARTRRAAVDALRHVTTDSSRDVLRLALADEELDVRMAAARALGAQEDTDALLLALDEAKSDAFRAVLYEALSACDPRAAAEAVRRAFVGSDRNAMLSALGAMPSLAEDHARELWALALEHSDPFVVRAALASADATVPEVRLRLPTLIAHTASDVRLIACQVFGESATEEERALLRNRLASERDLTVREAIRSVLHARREDS
jgi:HEAT repeat protein